MPVCSGRGDMAMCSELRVSATRNGFIAIARLLFPTLFQQGMPN